MKPAAAQGRARSPRLHSAASQICLVIRHPGWTGNESISRNPSRVPIFDSCTAHGAFKTADLARLSHVLAAIINRAAFAALIEAENQITRHSRIAIDDAGLSDEIIGKAFPTPRSAMRISHTRHTMRHPRQPIG